MKTTELKDKIANGEDSFTHFKEQIYSLKIKKVSRSLYWKRG